MSKKEETLVLRTGFLATDELGTKVLSKKTVSISLESALPFLAIPSDFVEKTKITEKTTAPVTDLNLLPNILVDAEPDVNGDLQVVERFIYISSITSPVTGNVMTMYYDKEFKDIILIPSLETIDTVDISSGAVEFKLSGFVIGVNHGINYENEIAKYPYTEENSIQLPEAKTNIEVTTSTCILKGAGGYDTDNGVSRYVSGTEYDSILPVRTPYTNLVKLGAVTEFLSEASRLPTYLVYQASKDRHAVARLGNVDTKTSDIYFELKF